MGTLNEHHRGKVMSMLEVENYIPFNRKMPSTKEIVDTLIKGSSDHKVRPPLRKAAANNLVRKIRKEKELYKAREGSYKDKTNYELQAAMTSGKQAEKRHKDAVNNTISVLVKNAAV